MSLFPQSAEIDDVVADGDIRFRSPTGVSRRLRVKVGRPRHLSDVADDDWLCPVWIEGVPEGVRCFAGNGPVESLMSALEWVRSRCAELDSERR